MATHEVTFPITDEAEILKLRAGDEVTVQGHIIGIRDRTQIRIFDQGVEPPMDLRGAFLLHTAPGVRKLGTDSEGRGRYEKVCIGTTTSARTATRSTTTSRRRPARSSRRSLLAFREVSRAMPSGLVAAGKLRGAASSVAPVASGYERSLRPCPACFPTPTRAAT